MLVLAFSVLFELMGYACKKFAIGWVALYLESGTS